MPIDEYGFIERLDLFKEDVVQAVRLKEQSLTSEHLSVLFKWLKDNYLAFKPEQLDLSGNNLGEARLLPDQELSTNVCNLIEADIDETSHLTWKEVDLSNNQFSIEQSEAILRSSKMLSSLRYFAFDGHALNENGFACLIRLIENNPDLERLSLKNCQVNDKQMVELFSVLARRSPYLRQIDVGGSQVSGEDEFNALIQLIRYNPNLEKLSLEDCHLEDEQVKLLALALQRHAPYFKELNLGGHNSYGKNGFMELVELVESNHGVVSIELNRDRAEKGLRYVPLDDRLTSNRLKQANLHAKIKNKTYRFIQLKEAMQDSQIDSFQVLLGPLENDQQKYQLYFALIDINFTIEKAQANFRHRAFLNQLDALNKLELAPNSVDSDVMFSSVLAEVAETNTLGGLDGLKAHEENGLVMPEIIKLLHEDFKAYIAQTLPELKFRYNPGETLQQNKAKFAALVEDESDRAEAIGAVHSKSTMERQRQKDKLLSDRIESFKDLDRRLTTLVRGQPSSRDITHHYREIQNHALLSVPFDLDWQEPGSGRTLLHYALMLEKPEYIKLLLERKADLLKLDLAGKSVLTYVYEAIMENGHRGPCHNVVLDYLGKASLINLRWGNEEALYNQEEQRLLKVKEHVDKYLSKSWLIDAQRPLILQILFQTYFHRKERAADCEELYRRIQAASPLDGDNQSLFTGFINFAKERLQDSSTTGIWGNSLLYQNLLMVSKRGHQHTEADRILRKKAAEAVYKAQQDQLASEEHAKSELQIRQEENVANDERIIQAQQQIEQIEARAQQEITNIRREAKEIISNIEQKAKEDKTQSQQEINAVRQDAAEDKRQSQLEIIAVRQDAQERITKAEERIAIIEQKAEERELTIQAQMAAMNAVLQNIFSNNPGHNTGPIPASNPVTAPFLSQAAQSAPSTSTSNQSLG